MLTWEGNDLAEKERAMRKRSTLTYNILLPIWLLVWFPTWLWLILIPANYLIDRIVLHLSLGDMEDRGVFCRHNTWRICVAGFLSDFVGSVLLIAAMVLIESFPGAHDLGYALTLNPFAHIGALAITIVAIAVAGLLIFKLDSWLLGNAGLDPERARTAALRLAILTAPYLFLFPAGLLYG